MRTYYLFLFVFFLLPGLSKSQSIQEIAPILFPEDQNLQEVFDMMWTSAMTKKRPNSFIKLQVKATTGGTCHSAVLLNVGYGAAMGTKS